jgi:1-acyl-sn-glycerol-3-phosphate acyltransferase
MLYYLRTFLLGGYFFFACLLTFIFCLFRPFHANNNWVLSRIMRPILFLLNAKIKVHSQTPYPDGPCIYIGNHQDFFDVYLLCTIYPKNTSIVGKTSLRWIPIFGQMFWLAGNILLDRGNKDKAWKTMHELADKVQELQRCLLIFPEGTRAKGKKLQSFKSGAFITAIKAGVPIVPFCFSTTHLNVDFNKWNAGHIEISFLDPIDTKGMTEEDALELSERCHAMMLERINEMDDAIAVQTQVKQQA